MAYFQHNITKLDGKPVRPVIDSYIALIFMAAAAVALVVGFIMMFVSSLENHTNAWDNWALLVWLVCSIILGAWWIRTEYIQRKEAFKIYSHKLSIYEKRKALVINNGGKWPTDEELYKKSFS